MFDNNTKYHQKSLTRIINLNFSKGLDSFVEDNRKLKYFNLYIRESVVLPGLKCLEIGLCKQPSDLPDSMDDFFQNTQNKISSKNFEILWVVPYGIIDSNLHFKKMFQRKISMAMTTILKKYNFEDHSYDAEDYWTLSYWIKNEYITINHWGL